MTEPHVAPRRTYYATAVALMALLALTVYAGECDLGAASTLIAMAIAVLKAGLVFVIFMHMRTSSPMMRIATTAGVFWLAIMVGLTLADVLTRGWVDAVPPIVPPAP